MTLPERFTLIRHGFSEANLIQQKIKQQSDIELPESFLSRHDSQMRLTELGVEQAIAAGEWLKRNSVTFDRFYVSPHTRTVETAHHLHLNGEWRMDDRFRERDWGETSTGTPMSEASRVNRSRNEWYWKPQAGESLATGVRLRVESVMNSLYRRENIESVVAVTHGEFIRASQFHIERLTPKQWLKMDEDEAYKMRNTMIVQYSRVNPNEGADKTPRTHYSWRRAICPWDESFSWDNGEWVEIGITKFSDDDLLKLAESSARIF